MDLFFPRHHNSHGSGQENSATKKMRPQNVSRKLVISTATTKDIRSALHSVLQQKARSGSPRSPCVGDQVRRFDEEYISALNPRFKVWHYELVIVVDVDRDGSLYPECTWRNHSNFTSCLCMREYLEISCIYSYNT